MFILPLRRLLVRERDAREGGLFVEMSREHEHARLTVGVGPLTGTFG